jgi:formyltetrahydrofolate deformylase
VRPRTVDDVTTWILTLSCFDRPGIVHAVSGAICLTGGNILSSQQFGDAETGRFFMRVAFQPGPRDDEPTWRQSFHATADGFAMDWELHDAAVRTPTLLMVGTGGHCLNDLFFRATTGSLPVDLRAVVSNHTVLRPLADHYRVPFVHLPVEPDGKAAAEARLLELVHELGIELVVLARYMQVLSDDTCKRLEGRAINIHHSFLPSFKGAGPYHQAHTRGVKLIGATAHYVTADLDEGPIIEQDVTRVDHALTPEDLTAIGRDTEASVLARAVRWHAEHRVLLNGLRTVVFR